MVGVTRRSIGIVTTLVLLLLLLVPTVSTPRFVHAEEGFVLSDYGFNIDFIGEGERIAQFQLGVTNTVQETRNYTVGYWNYKVNPPEGWTFGNESWIESIIPDAFTVPPSGKGITNVKLNIPTDVEDGKYVIYLKVEDSPLSGRVPVTLFLRISETPIHQYSIGPGIYNVNVEGEGTVDEVLDITIWNKGSENATYRVYPRLPDDPENINPEYEVGDLGWLGGEITVNITPGDKDTVHIGLAMPSSTPTGKYKVWIGVRDITQTGSVQIEYATKVLIDVDRGDDPATPVIGFPTNWLIIGGVVGVGVLSLAAIWKWHEHKSRNKEFTPADWD